MGSNFGAGTVFLILLLKEIQGSSSVLPFVFEAQPNQSKLQILKSPPKTNRPNGHSTSRFANPQKPILRKGFHCIQPLYSPKKNIKRRCFQGIFSPQLSFTSFTHRFIMAPSYRPISSITESLTLENTGPLEATGPPPS